MKSRWGAINFCQLNSILKSGGMGATVVETLHCHHIKLRVSAWTYLNDVSSAQSTVICSVDPALYLKTEGP